MELRNGRNYPFLVEMDFLYKYGFYRRMLSGLLDTFILRKEFSTLTNIIYQLSYLINLDSNNMIRRFYETYMAKISYYNSYSI